MIEQYYGIRHFIRIISGSEKCSFLICKLSEADLHVRLVNEKNVNESDFETKKQVFLSNF